MKNIDIIKSSKEEFINFLLKLVDVDSYPWVDYFNEKFCANCPAIQHKREGWFHEGHFCYCELHNKCRFFPELDDVPDEKQMIEMWLEEEAE